MHEAEEMFREFSLNFDYFGRLLYIKENSQFLNSRFIDILTIHAKIFLDEGEIPLSLEFADLAIIASDYIVEPSVKASCLVLKSQLVQLQNNYIMAEKYLHEAEEIYKGEKLDEKLCDVYNLIAYLYKSQKKYEESSEYYRRAIELSKTLNKKDSYALNLSALGEIEYFIEHPQQSLWYFHQSLYTYRELGDLKSQGQILNWIGYVNIYLKEYDAALKYFLESLQVLSRDKDELDSSLVYAKFHLGTIYHKKQDDDRSLHYFLEALKMWKKREYLQVLSEMNFFWGKVYVSLGLIERGINFFEQSLRALQKLSNKKGMISLLFYIRNLKTDFDERESINNFFARSLKVLPDEVNLDGDVYLFDIISKNYKDFIYKDKRNVYFNPGATSYAIKQNINPLNENYRKHFLVNHSHPSIALRQIASIYSAKDMPVNAFPYLIELFHIKKKIYNSEMLSQLLNILRKIPTFFYDELSPYLEEIVRLTDKFLNKGEQALIFYELGLVYFNGDNYDKSYILFLNALSLCSYARNKDLESKIYRALGWAEYRRGFPERAIHHLREGLKVDGFRKTAHEFLDLLIIGHLYLKRKDFVNSLDYQKRAILRGNEMLYSANPLLLLRNVLLKSGTYCQLGIFYRLLYEKQVDSILYKWGILFEEKFPVHGDEIISIYKKKFPKELEDFFLNQYMALITLSRGNVYEGIHFFIKSLKIIFSLSSEKDDRVFLLRMGLMYQSIDINIENRWQMRLVDEYFIDLADSKGDSPFSLRAAVLFNISVILGLKGNFSKALSVLNEADEIEGIEKNIFRQARIYYQKAVIKEAQDNLYGAISDYKRSIQLFRSLDDRYSVARCLNKLAVLESHNRTDYILEALSSIDGEKDPLLYGQLLFNWAMVLKGEEDFIMESFDVFKESLEYFQKFDFPQCTLIVLKTLSSISTELGMDQMAASFLDDAWKVLKNRIPDGTWEKIRFILKKDNNIRKDEEALFYFQKALFCNISSDMITDKGNL